MLRPETETLLIRDERGGYGGGTREVSGSAIFMVSISGNKKASR
jgi:hypothetical protein